MVLAGLIEWRHRFGAPKNRFTKAVSIATQAREILSETSWNERWRLFHFPIAALVMYLVNGNIGDSLLSELPPLAQKGSLADMPALLDTALVASVRQGAVADEFESLLACFGSNKRMKLLHQTYANYVAMLRKCDRMAPFDDEVQLGEKLFAQRKTNTHYYSARMDGGGVDNNDTVDFRLAVILKYCTGRNPGVESPETIHAWVG